MSKSKVISLASHILKPHYRGFDNQHPKTIASLIKQTAQPQPLLYKMHPIQSVPLSSLKQPHPQPLGTLQKLPFHIQRTTSGNLPVYSDYKHNHNIKRTIIRKINGNVIEFAQQIQKLVSGAQVRIKVGHIVIPGLHKQSVEMWLLRLGF